MEEFRAGETAPWLRVLVPAQDLCSTPRAQSQVTAGSNSDSSGFNALF